MEQNPKEKEILAELRKSRKTWKQLEQNLKMSKKTLYLRLMKLMSDRIVEKYGLVEYGKIVDYYDLVKRKDAPIVVNVPKMFEKGDDFFPIRIKKDLDVTQSLVYDFYHYFAWLMHLARKTLDAYFAKELSPKQRIQYVNNWKKSAVDYASEWVEEFIEWIVRYGQESWRDTFGSFEDNPNPFFKAVFKYTEIMENAKKEQIMRQIDDIQNKGMRVLDLKKGRSLSGKELALAQKHEIKRLEKELVELS